MISPKLTPVVLGELTVTLEAGPALLAEVLTSVEFDSGVLLLSLDTGALDTGALDTGELDTGELDSAELSVLPDDVEPAVVGGVDGVVPPDVLLPQPAKSKRPIAAQAVRPVRRPETET